LKKEGARSPAKPYGKGATQIYHFLDPGNKVAPQKCLQGQGGTLDPPHRDA
jgi:hypothetical protein